jgi:hypothetical protein
MKFHRSQHFGAPAGLATQDRHRGFVAGGFDRKKHGHAVCLAPGCGESDQKMPCGSLLFFIRV